MRGLFSSKEWETLINHILFPIRLPQQADDPSLDCTCLKLINQVFSQIGVTLGLEKIENLFKSWTNLQTYPLDGKTIHSAIAKTIEDKVDLPIYLPNQNTCLIISIKSNQRAIISYFQVGFKNFELMSKECSDIESIYPTASFHVSDLTILRSIDFAKLLADLANTLCEESSAITIKADHSNVELRDLAKPILISDWLAPVLIGNEDYIKDGLKIRKKIRDEVNYYCTEAPFRRMG